MIPDEALRVFSDPTWINFGEVFSPAIPERVSKVSWLHKGKQLIKRGLRALNREYDQRCKAREDARVSRQERIQAMEVSPFFRPFWRSIDGRLDFSDNTFSFVFSEHFFEHIWPDEAYALFRECFRVLRREGVLRISVPDADLRTYEGPEPIAFDAGTLAPSRHGWTHPGVHKTRWNIYLLRLLLFQAGFQVRPIVYCDKDGRYFSDWPLKGDTHYATDSD